VTTLPLMPRKGGFMRPFGCGEFVRDFLLGNGPYGSPVIDPTVGSPQSDILYFYKTAILREMAINRATRAEERQAKREKRSISPENIERLAEAELRRIPYKSNGCRGHSFNVYFSNLKRLGWVEPSGVEEPSAFQQHYPAGPPRRYYRLTAEGTAASEAEWRNPFQTLYGAR